MFSPYRAFLSTPGARRLLISAVLTRMPTGMLSLSILLLVRARTGSLAVAGVAVGAFALAGAAIAPVQGALVDRFGQPKVLGVCAGGQACALVILVAAAQGRLPSAYLVVLASLAGVLVPPTMACARALWPVIAPDSSTLSAAYALDAVAQEAAWVLGPLLVIAAVEVSSSEAAVLLCAAMTMLGTAVFTTSPESRQWRGGHQRRARAGALASAHLRRLLGPIVLTGFWWGSIQVGLPALALQLDSRAAAGWLLAVVSVGGVTGGILYGALPWRRAIAARYVRILLLMGVSLAPLVVAHSLAAVVPFSFLAGLAMTPMIACQNTLVGRAAPAGAMTEAFTWSTAAVYGGIAAGSAAAGWSANTVGVGAPFAAACSAALVASGLALIGHQRGIPGTAIERTDFNAPEQGALPSTVR